MTAGTRQNALVAALLLMLLAAIGWSANWMMDRRADAQQAADDYAACVELGEAIKSAGPSTGVSTGIPTGAEELAARIGPACSQASVSSEANAAGPSLEGKFPQSARAIPDSGLAVVPTVLSLRNVSALQLATFLFHLTEGSSLSVSDLRLRTPHGDTADEVWDAETTVTYLIPAGGKPARGE